MTDSSGGTPYAQYSAYNALEQPTSITYGNQVVTNYSYSNANNSLCTAQSFRICTIQTTRPGNLTVQNLQYGYDPKGNIKQITDVINGNQSFILDDLDRLTSATGPYGANSSTATITYAYNLIGNMTCNSYISTCTASATNYTYGSSAHVHAVTAVTGGLNYGYDANGNMTSRGNNNLAYDYENRLTSVTSSSGSSTTTMIYDGDGGRVKKTVNGTTTIYVGKLYECTGGICLKYIFGGNSRIAVKPVSGGGIYYYHTDYLGSSSLTTDINGAVSESIAYLPFGQTRLDSGGSNTAYKYTGQYFDSDTSLYFYSARYYDPVLARFVSADTVVGRPRDPQTLNRYSYVRNNPIIYSDPSGHCWCMDQITQAFSDAGNAISNEANRFSNSMSVGSSAGHEIAAGVIVVGTGVACGFGVAPACYAFAGEIAGGTAGGVYCNNGGNCSVSDGIFYGTIGGGAIATGGYYVCTYYTCYANLGAAGACAGGNCNVTVGGSGSVNGNSGDNSGNGGTGGGGSGGSGDTIGNSSGGTSANSYNSLKVQYEPLPPGWTPEWEWRYPESTNPDVTPRWFDPIGGEWRWHAPDNYHPEGHWDYNPWNQWNSPWQNIKPGTLTPYPEPGEKSWSDCFKFGPCS